MSRFLNWNRSFSGVAGLDLISGGFDRVWCMSDSTKLPCAVQTAEVWRVPSMLELDILCWYPRLERLYQNLHGAGSTEVKVIPNSCWGVDWRSLDTGHVTFYQHLWGWRSVFTAAISLVSSCEVESLYKSYQSKGRGLGLKDIVVSSACNNQAAGISSVKMFETSLCRGVLENIQLSGERERERERGHCDLK